LKTFVYFSNEEFWKFTTFILEKTGNTTLEIRWDSNSMAPTLNGEEMGNALDYAVALKEYYVKEELKPKYDYLVELVKKHYVSNIFIFYIFIN
jgi:hypothetical protein